MKSKTRKKPVVQRAKPSGAAAPPKDASPPAFGRRKTRQIELSAKPGRKVIQRNEAEQRSSLSSVIARLFKR